jgi:hypothetical protein
MNHLNGLQVCLRGSDGIPLPATNKGKTMKYMLVIALMLVLPLHAMESEKFEALFKRTPAPSKKLGIFKNLGPYLKTIRHLHKDAREKKKLLCNIQRVLQERKAAGILKHVVTFDTKFDEYKTTDEMLNIDIKKLKENLEHVLVTFIDETDKQCKEDIAKIDAARKSYFGMYRDPSLRGRVTHWEITYETLNIIKASDAEQDALKLLVQKDPAQLQEVYKAMEAIQEEQSPSGKQQTVNDLLKLNDADDDDDDDE